MSAGFRWWDIQYLRPSKVESTILETLARIERGNAYQVWKNSGLKHYPTVLRTLKKLEKKRLINTLVASGMRGEKTFSSTLGGVLVHLIFSGNEKKVVEIVLKESSLFRELYKVEKDNNWAFSSTQRFILSMQKDKRPLSFDEAVRNSVHAYVVDTVMDAFLNENQESLAWLAKQLKVRWVKDVIAERIQEERAFMVEATRRMDAFEKEFELGKHARSSQIETGI